MSRASATSCRRAAREDARNGVADRKAPFLEQAHDGGRDIRLAARFAPALLDLAHELARMSGPAVVMRRLSYWMYSWKIATPPGRMTAASLSDQERRRGDEAGDPAAPACIHAARGQRIRHQVEFVIPDVAEPVAREHRAARLDEARGAPRRRATWPVGPTMSARSADAKPGRRRRRAPSSPGRFPPCASIRARSGARRRVAGRGARSPRHACPGSRFVRPPSRQSHLALRKRQEENQVGPDHDRRRKQVAVFPVEFRHVVEVHAIDPGDQRRHGDQARRRSREPLHRLVFLQPDHREVHGDCSRDGVADGLDGLVQALQVIGDVAEVLLHAGAHRAAPAHRRGC